MIKKEHEGLMFPDEIENSYSKKLTKIVNVMDKKLKKIIKQKKNYNLDDDYEEEFMEYMKNYLTNEFCVAIAVDYTTQAVEYSIIQVNNQIKKVSGIDFKDQFYYDEETIKKQIRDQVKLIKEEPAKYLRTYDKQVEKLVKQKVEEGLTTKTLTEAIVKTTGIEKNRANLIARDQVGKVFAESTKTQFKGIGLKKFEWITVGDSRVRTEHRDRAGNIYEWDNPPSGEIPGSAIACRCIAGVVVSEIISLNS